MNNKFIKQEIHRPRPVTIERGDKGVIIIEGISFHSDFFRMYARPQEDVLYAIRSEADSVVHVTMIKSMDEAKMFFDPTQPPSAEAVFPQIGEHDLGEEDQVQDQEQGVEDGL